MMIFADTFYFLALLNRRDAAHDRAIDASRTYARSLITTVWILTEIADGCAYGPLRHGFIQLLAVIQSDPGIKVVPCSAEIFERGLQLYRDRPDKDWSLTDCLSFIAMADRNITEALTGDHHFQQAGFKILLG